MPCNVANLRRADVKSSLIWLMFIAVATGVSLLLLFLGFVGFHMLKKINRLEIDIKAIKTDGVNAKWARETQHLLG